MTEKLKPYPFCGGKPYLDGDCTWRIACIIFIAIAELKQNRLLDLTEKTKLSNYGIRE